MSEFAKPNLTLVALSNQGILVGFIDQDSESKPAKITILADCPNASLGEHISTFAHLILSALLCSLEVTSLTKSIKFNPA